jgi:hypothetical protein
MARQPWGSLSESYRARLERAGITPQMHEQGISIREARGHAKTPEHPQEAARHPSKFEEYVRERQRLLNLVNQRKRDLFGRSSKFNRRNARRITEFGADGKTPPSNAQLRWAANADDEELYERLNDHDDSFLFYH